MPTSLIRHRVTSRALLSLFLLALIIAPATQAGGPVVRVLEFPGCYASELVSFQSALYFFSACPEGPGQSRHTLWRSDGTAGGTTAVKSWISDSNGGAPRSLTATETALFFRVETRLTYELWASDGTTAGTTMLRRFSSPYDQKEWLQEVLGNTLYVLIQFFDEQDRQRIQLWRSDGTDAGTALVSELLPPANALQREQFPMIPSQQVPPYLASMKSLGSTIVMAVQDPNAGRGIYYLWRSDGTSETTRMFLADRFYLSAGFIEYHGRLLFGGTPVAAGGATMVWATDGTPSGTMLVSPGNVIAATRDYFYFVTAQGMFRSDGTAACTLQLGQSPQGDSIDLGDESFIDGGASGEAILIFQVNRPFPMPPEIWGTDGSPSGTAPLPKLSGLSTMVPVSVASATFLLFTKAIGATEYTLWRTDGTDAGTASIQSGLPEAPSSAAVVFGDSLYGTGWSKATSSALLWSLPLTSVEPGAAPGNVPGAAPPARVFMPLIDNPC